ncbi:MAG: PD40 domain-containing protein [Ignavibacteria bacterium]|nr:PD40 domain-containing protein [Ignavibacteria bacterium]
MRIITTYLFLLCLLSTANSQFVDFGRNKVMYQDFDWYVLSTPHFKIHYYKQAKELTEQGAYLLEESYKELQRKFNHTIGDTNPIIIYASPLHFKQTNTTPYLIPEGVGGFFEFIKNRVVLPFNGSLSQFRHVSKHELVHVFTVSKVVSVLKSHGYIAERLPPLWFIEGIAEYWSTEWDTQSEMVLKDAVLNSYLPGINDYESIYGSYLMYKLGQKACEFIALNYGEEALTRLMDNFWMSDSFSDVMKFTIGKDYREFDKEFLYYLKKKYFPQISSQDDPSQSSIQLYSRGFAHKPVFYKNGRNNEVFFIGNKRGYTSIYKINLTPHENEEELIIEGESSEEYEEFHFFRTGLDITENGILAFITQKGGSDVLNIFDTKTSKKNADYAFENIVNIGSPSFSKDGETIVFSANDFSGKSDLFIFNLLTENLTRLTNDYYDDRDADISPDGKSIVFSSDRSNPELSRAYNLHLLNIETKEIKQITSGKETNYSPRFSKDGKKIVYTSDKDGRQNIWILISDKDTITSSRITNFTTAAFDPRWVGEDSLVFSCYEKAMITIRLIDNIEKKTEQNTDIKSFITDIPGKSFEFKNYKLGTSQAGSLKYKKEYSFDFALTGISSDPIFGTSAGGVLSLSDMLGDEKYNVLIFNSSNADADFWKSFNIAVSKLSLEQRLNYAFGVYHLYGRRYDLASSDFVYYERLYGSYISFSYPLSFFRRIETTTSISQSFKDIDLFDIRRGILLSNTISYVYDNTLWYYTGPLDGMRYNVSLGYTTDIFNSTENFVTLMLDFRNYFRISGPVSLAFRGQFMINEGKNARRFYTGGSWSLRGWPFISIRGTKFALANAELRFPLIDRLRLGFPENINIDFYGIRGALFFDAGNCWDIYEQSKEVKGSIGAGIRINILGIVVLRYDFGKRIEQRFTKLQSGLFHQVFFGWDF